MWKRCKVASCIIMIQTASPVPWFSVKHFFSTKAAFAPRKTAPLLHHATTYTRTISEQKWIFKSRINFTSFQIFLMSFCPSRTTQRYNVKSRGPCIKSWIRAWLTRRGIHATIPKLQWRGCAFGFRLISHGPVNYHCLVLAIHHCCLCCFWCLSAVRSVAIDGGAQRSVTQATGSFSVSNTQTPKGIPKASLFLASVYLFFSFVSSVGLINLI